MKINLQKPAFDSYLSFVKNQFTNIVLNSDTTHSSKSILDPPAFVGFFIGQIVTSRPIVQDLSELKTTESYSGIINGKEDKIVKSLVLDRFDPGKRVKGLIEDIKSNGHSDRVPTITLDGDIVVKVYMSKMNDDNSSENSHAESSQSSNFESTPFSITILFKHENDKSQIHSSCHLFASPYSFEYNLIHPLRIVPTTLSTRLLISSSNNSQDDEEEEYEMGYVTINRARQAFLIASTDPRRKTVPLVGIWIQGPQDLKELNVYAACTRYIRNQELCKLKSIDQSFLVVLIPHKSSGTRRNAKFYECRFQEPIRQYLSYDDAQTISTDVSKRPISLSCQWRLKENNEKDSQVET
ncbi:SCL-interrupting locus protein N-terminus-domain-containing protein [Paraphysoderma sedebokerense]|nr:SCL-interrupting locus protein N-terminus-domain-containing protein [Paraphysoderma sedebokerense]